jgi:hypothetical protein
MRATQDCGNAADRHCPLGHDRYDGRASTLVLAESSCRRLAACPEWPVLGRSAVTSGAKFFVTGTLNQDRYIVADRRPVEGRQVLANRAGDLVVAELGPVGFESADESVNKASLGGFLSVLDPRGDHRVTPSLCVERCVARSGGIRSERLSGSECRRLHLQP